jgi:hypothetical protein
VSEDPSCNAAALAAHLATLIFFVTVHHLFGQFAFLDPPSIADGGHYHRRE